MTPILVVAAYVLLIYLCIALCEICRIGKQNDLLRKELIACIGSMDHARKTIHCMDMHRAVLHRSLCLAYRQILSFQKQICNSHYRRN